MIAYTIIWQPAAVAGWIRVRTRDPLLAKGVRDAVTALSDEPYPNDSAELGSRHLRRIRLDGVRILYRVDDADLAVEVLVVGQVPAA